MGVDVFEFILEVLFQKVHQSVDLLDIVEVERFHSVHLDARFGLYFRQTFGDRKFFLFYFSAVEIINIIIKVQLDIMNNFFFCVSGFDLLLNLFIIHIKVLYFV